MKPEVSIRKRRLTGFGEPMGSLLSQLLLSGIVCLTLCALGCGAPKPEPEAPSRHDPAVAELERMLSRGSRDQDLPGCLARARAEGGCVARRGRRILDVKVALDPRYRRQWPNWQTRLARTFQCVNALYANTKLQWRVSRLVWWDPGADRHRLYSLLHRLRHEVPADPNALRLGISVWEERRIYRMAGGEIGLSQAGACVVPSWPRAENDCVILAHELGHLVGARHVPGKQWVMGWAAHPFHLPATDPLARVIATYRFHPRNVLAIDAHAAAKVTGNGLVLSPACRALLGRVDRCYGL